ncbi:unnamed protein product [Hyaloperonospora brassicae]|uniref:BSD domain-containing protein n=1 Tax=Hyaloperonospora brassicae TaxID=162125 RepID=A0AAV0T5M4_HYABA|nr:unnamed protein product [Hyaloperonospora brassicae]
MWELLELAVKSASANAATYASAVHEKAQTIAAAVQDEASTLVQRVRSAARTGPVDDILYEELAAYREFSSAFALEAVARDIARVTSEDAEVCLLHEAVVPLELSEDEFWCRYFFRQQQVAEQVKPKRVASDSDKALEGGEQSCGDSRADGWTRNGKHSPEDDPPPRSYSCSVDRRGDRGDLGPVARLLREADEADHSAVAQWQQKARDLHCQLQETKQSYDAREQKARKEWDKQLQALCDTYETRMAAVAARVDAAWTAGYDEGARASDGVGQSVRQQADQDMAQLRREMSERVLDTAADERVAALTNEKEDLQRELQAARERIAEQGKQDELLAEKTQGAALADVTKERDVWRARAVKMKKLKDLVQTELTTLRQQRDVGAETASIGSHLSATVVQFSHSDDHGKLQTRMNELQVQLANALADSEARAREAYEKGVEAGKIEAEQREKQVRDVAFREGYKKAQAEVKSEMGVLKAELGMFRAFHESAIHCADHVDGNAENLLDNSLDDILLADGQSLCSPTSSVSVFTDNGKNEFPFGTDSKSNDDWGEW